MGWILSLLLAFLTCSCYVNRASIDPFAYAPPLACWYWGPDEKADKLACADPVSDCPDIPNPEAIHSLAEVLDIALINNPQTQISWARAREYAAEYGLSQSSAFPTITGSYFYKASRLSFLASTVEQSQNVNMDKLIINDQQEWGPQANVTWTLLDFGQRRFTSLAARYSLYYADYTHNEAIQTVIQDVTIDYYDYLYQKKLLEAYKADLLTAQETLDAAKLGLQTGAKNVSDVLQAKSAALQAEIKLSEQQKGVNSSYAILLDRMGLPANLTLNVQDLPFVDPKNTNLAPIDDYLCIAMGCRPDLLAARAAVRSSELSLKAAQRAWTPVVDYSLQIGNTTFNGGFNNGYNYVNTLTVSMPIFTGFEIRNTIRKNEAIVELEEATLKEVELGVVRDVTTAHFNVNVAFNTLHAAIRFLRTAEEEYEVAISQYKQGVNTILDVLSAQSSLFDARATQARATEQWFNTLSTLTYSAGLLSANLGGCP